MVIFKDGISHLLGSLLVLSQIFYGVSSFGQLISEGSYFRDYLSEDSTGVLFPEMWVSSKMTHSAMSLGPDTTGIQTDLKPLLSNLSKTDSSKSLSDGNSLSCIDNSLRLLFQEDSVIVTANFITQTTDGDFLIPGYYYPKTGIFYNMPYLIKATARGNILWSKSYPSLGVFPSSWFTATRIKELSNGDLLMVGQIGIPGTDDRRELAVWRLDKKGNQIWAVSYENRLWTNPITGSTEITGIQEDSKGDIYLSGNLRFFESSKFAFVLKINSNGNILWDRNFSLSDPLAFGLLLLQKKLLLIGSAGPSLLPSGLNSNILWCIGLNPDNGDTLNTKGWYADYGPQSKANSFAYSNTNLGILDNGRISVFGTANSDFLGFVGQNLDTIHHSIVANFNPDFDFLSGIMLGSKHSTNYYNTVATQHSNGRISYSRFSGNHHLYNEDIIYGNIQNGQVVREKMYHEPNRSGAAISNFIFYQPGEDIVIQAYNDSTNRNGGLEMIRLYDGEASDACNGKDTSLTFVQSYFMAPASAPVDSIISGAFHLTKHNFVRELKGNLTKISGCQPTDSNVHADPFINLEKDSLLCKGSTRQLSAGTGYSKYIWSDGSSNSSILIGDTGRYWVSVTDQYGCKGSDTSSIRTFVSLPSAFLPPDTFFCKSYNLTIIPQGAFQNYLWSNLSNGAALTVSQAGSYWLQVTDSNNCVGRDTINIAERNCPVDLMIPSAFTPNGDGRNDIFRPFFFGNVIKFRFTIFNRWGERVFETEALQKGWDGKVAGIPADYGVFVWYCAYQLEGHPQKTEKATVVLIR